MVRWHNKCWKERQSLAHLVLVSEAAWWSSSLFLAGEQWKTHFNGWQWPCYKAETIPFFFLWEKSGFKFHAKIFLPYNMAAVKPLYNQCAYMCKSFLHQKKRFFWNCGFIHGSIKLKNLHQKWAVCVYKPTENLKFKFVNSSDLASLIYYWLL